MSKTLFNVTSPFGRGRGQSRGRGSLVIRFLFNAEPAGDGKTCDQHKPSPAGSALNDTLVKTFALLKVALSRPLPRPTSPRG